MPTFSVPEIFISVPFVKAWAEATHDKKTTLIMEEIIASLAEKVKGILVVDIHGLSQQQLTHRKPVP